MLSCVDSLSGRLSSENGFWPRLSHGMESICTILGEIQSSKRGRTDAYLAEMAHFSLEAFEETVSPINFHRHSPTLNSSEDSVNDNIQTKTFVKRKNIICSVENHIFIKN